MVEKRGLTAKPSRRIKGGQSIISGSLLTQELGLEVSLDFQDEYVEIYLVKLMKGKRPRDISYTSATGERIRMPVMHLLNQDLYAHDERLDGMRRMIAVWTARSYRGDEYAEDVLTTMAEVVEHYLDFFLQQPEQILFPPKNRVSG